MDLQELKKRIIKSNSTRYTHLLNDGKDFTKSKTQSYERSKHQPRIPVKPHNEKDNTELKQKYNEPPLPLQKGGSLSMRLKN